MKGGSVHVSDLDTVLSHRFDHAVSILALALCRHLRSHGLDYGGPTFVGPCEDCRMWADDLLGQIRRSPLGRSERAFGDISGER